MDKTWDVGTETGLRRVDFVALACPEPSSSILFVVYVLSTVSAVTGPGL